MGRRVTAVSHLLFADDMLVFTNGRARSLRSLMGLLKVYENSSGQQVNLQKSSYYASKHINRRRRARIELLTGCPARSFPVTYLGAPLFKGRVKLVYFEDLINKINSKIEGWHSRYLSFALKITLINSVLSSMPVHTLSCMVISKTVIRRIENTFRTFLWANQGQHRHHWVSWKTVCAPKDEGGLGIWALWETIHGCHGKLAWKVFSGSSLWARVLQQKYGMESAQQHINLWASASRL